MHIEFAIVAEKIESFLGINATAAPAANSHALNGIMKNEKICGEVLSTFPTNDEALPRANSSANTRDMIVSATRVAINGTLTT